MNEAAIRKRINELQEALTALPPSQVGQKQKGAGSSGDSVYGPVTSTGAQSVEDSFDQLRLHIKYMMFDLEATRRENRYLRQMIDNRRPPESGGSKGPNNDY